MLKQLQIKLLYPVYVPIKNAFNLSGRYGQLKTAINWSCVDSAGNEIPWYTYPCIEYLEQLDFRQKTVFEYGSGNSTLFWAKKAAKVFAVEDDLNWYTKVKAKLPKNVSYFLAKNKKTYLTAIATPKIKYDVIIIDGSYRKECVPHALKYLRKDGIIILDNSDWHLKAAKTLRNTFDCIPVDFHGFGPINAYSWTTSIFFSRSWRIKPRNSVHPQPSKAASPAVG